MKRTIAFITFVVVISVSLLVPLRVSAQIKTPADENIGGFITPETVEQLRPNCKSPNGKYGTYLKGLAKAGVSFFTTASLGAPSDEVFCRTFEGDIDILKKSLEGSGALGFANSVSTALLDQRPLSTQDYIQDKVYALTGRVSAQVEPAPYFSGLGYDLLQPIQAFWGWSVNVVYSVLILIIIGIAFAIVFRQKIGGKEIVQIQSAIPSIALAMILVPLSYAISGLFIDFISVGTNVVHSFFFAAGAPARSLYEARSPNSVDCLNDPSSTGTTDDPCDRGLYADDSRLTVWNFREIIDVSDEVEGVAESEVSGTGTRADGNGINSFVIMDIVRRILDLLAGTQRSPAYWFGEIVNAILGLLMVWIGIKIAWILLKKYITLILAPIAAPFIFASVAIPGNSTNAIMNYIKMMGSASLLYIVTYLMFIVTYVFTSGVLNEQLPNFQRGIFIPPLLGLRDIFQSVPTGTSQSFTDLLFAIIGLGVYFSIPKTLEGIDKSLGGSFSIPAFITTPLEALRDSANVTFRGAPSAAIRVGQITGRGARGVAYSPTRTVQGYQDLRDRMRGLEPGQEGTARRKRASAIAKKIDEIDRKIAEEQAKGPDANGGVINRLQAQKQGLNIQASAFGIQENELRPEKPADLKASFAYNGSPIVNITKAAFDQYIDDMTAPGAPATITLPPRAKFILEASQFKLPARIKAEVYTAKPKADYAGEDTDLKLVDNIVAFPAPGPAWQPAIGPKNLFVNEDKPFPFSANTTGAALTPVIEVRVAGSMLPVPSKDGSKWEIPVDIVITDPLRFFGNVLASNRNVASEKVIFKIGQYESNSVSMVIQVVG